MPNYHNVLAISNSLFNLIKQRVSTTFTQASLWGRPELLMLNFSKNSAVAWFPWWLRMVNGERILFLEERTKKEKRESSGRPQGEACPFFARNPKIGRTCKPEQTERDLPFVLIAAFPSSSSQSPIEAGAEDEFRGQRGHKYCPVVDNDRAVLEMSPMDPSSLSSSSSSLPVHQASLNLSQSSLVPAASPVRDSPTQQTHPKTLVSKNLGTFYPLA
ncbi:hypothetical protein DVH24_021370 [Malus domestica]|uniref:Uncharacterized protein n=1 Tax=Malus domestica TaxID=3750 RepID=A0A498JUN2_MALDO|nr:hypothetical protein DVH24_021370 [Malus domestica]